jgi:hypothetical protein
MSDSPTDPHADLLRELLTERFYSTKHRPKPPRGDVDTPDILRRRREILCAAMDEADQRPDNVIPLRLVA